MAGNDDWDDAPSSKPAQSDNSWKNKAATSSNNDGWDDDPKPSNNRQNGKSFFFVSGLSPYYKIVPSTYKK